MRRVLLALALLGCDTEQHTTTPPIELSRIPELRDCVMVNFDPGGMLPYMHVVRCPLSITTTHFPAGKQQVDVGVIDEAPLKPRLSCSHSSGATYTCVEAAP